MRSCRKARNYVFTSFKKWSLRSPLKTPRASTIFSIETPPNPASPPPSTPTPIFSTYLAGDARHLLYEAKSPEERDLAEKKMRGLPLNQQEAEMVETMARRRIGG